MKTEQNPQQNYIDLVGGRNLRFMGVMINLLL